MKNANMDDREQDVDTTTKAQESDKEEPPFKEFQQTLAFLASIGLAASTACAFSLVGLTSSLGDTSPAALAAVKESAILLAWSSACFIVAIAIIVTTQLLYTEKVIVAIITRKDLKHWQEKVVRVGVAVFAWVSLGFQTAALLLFSQALSLISTGSMKMARYGIVGGMCVVFSVTLLGIVSQKEGQVKLRTLGIRGGEEAK